MLKQKWRINRLGMIDLDQARALLDQTPKYFILRVATLLFLIVSLLFPSISKQRPALGLSGAISGISEEWGQGSVCIGILRDLYTRQKGVQYFGTMEFIETSFNKAHISQCATRCFLAYHRPQFSPDEVKCLQQCTQSVVRNQNAPLTLRPDDKQFPVWVSQI